MSTFPSLTDDELCIINYSNIENLDFVCSCCGAHSQAIGHVERYRMRSQRLQIRVRQRKLCQFRVVFLVRHGVSCKLEWSGGVD